MADIKIKQKEPLIHITKRDDVSFSKSIIIHLIGIAVALVLSSLLIVAVTGENPLKLFKAMYEGVIGTPAANMGINKKYMESIHIAAILLCVSLAVTPAFKMKFWNIGAEGQVLMGCLASAYCMLEYGGKVDNTVLIIIMLLSSILVSAVWAVIPAICKAFWNTNETLFTLMMNYCAMQLVSFFIVKWESPKDSGKVGVINLFGEHKQVGWLPKIFGQDYLLNILIVVGITVLMYVYLKYSKQGFEISVVGESENTARYVGINVKKVIIRTMAISGAVCGLAGVLLVSGTHHTIAANTAGGNGFTAVMVSWLAKFNPLFMAGVAFFIAFLEEGAGGIATHTGLNASLADIIIGIILFFIIGSEFFLNYRIVFNKQRGGEKKGEDE